MCTGNLAIDGTSLAAVAGILGTVEEGYTFAKVPSGIGGAVDMLDLDKTGLG